MALIIIVTIVIYFMSIKSTWNNLGEIGKIKKIATIAIGFLITYIITLILFSISKNSIQYNNTVIAGDIKIIIVAICTGINSLIILPYIARQLDKVHVGDIEQNEFFKKIVIIIVVFIICLFFEYGYMKDTQVGILKIYQAH